MRVRALSLVVTCILLLAACGGDGEQPSDDGSTPASQDLGSKPTFEIASDEQPPADLQVEVLAEGDGAVVEDGQTLVMHYVGKSWSTGEQFDASWDREQLFSFTLGEGRVIPGWERGIGGTADGRIAPMRVGERRRITIPPELGYGEAGAAGGAIGPNETLVFVVDLIGIEGA